MPDPVVHPDSFWLVIVGESIEKPPACIECKDQKSFEAAIKDNVLSADQELYVFAFKGNRIPVGSLQPIGSYKLGDQTIQVSKDVSSIDASGKIQPLVPKTRS